MRSGGSPPTFRSTTLGQGPRGYSDATAQARFSAFLLALFAGVALALAALGTCGVVASGVAQRAREIGIPDRARREPAGVVRMVIRQ